MSPKQKLIILCLLGFLGLLIYRVLDHYHYLTSYQDGQLILAYLQSPGPAGPIMIVIMMAVAIMVSPLPSAPVAIAPASFLLDHVGVNRHCFTGVGYFLLWRCLSLMACEKRDSRTLCGHN